MLQYNYKPGPTASGLVLFGFSQKNLKCHLPSETFPQMEMCIYDTIEWVFGRSYSWNEEMK